MVFGQLSNINYCRPPEFDEIEKMFAPQTGLFEDTVENQVVFFNFVFGHLDFNLKKLRALPENVAGRLIETYLKRPRTIQEYCDSVW